MFLPPPRRPHKRLFVWAACSREIVCGSVNCTLSFSADKSGSLQRLSGPARRAAQRALQLCCVTVEALDSSAGWVVFLLIQVPEMVSVYSVGVGGGGGGGGGGLPLMYDSVCAATKCESPHELLDIFFFPSNSAHVPVMC